MPEPAEKKPPVDPGPPEDAQVVDEPKAAPNSSPRPEVKPASAAEAFGVFDGEVEDAKNARRTRQEPRTSTKVKGAKGKKGKAAAAAEEPAEPELTPEQLWQKKLGEARGLVRMWDRMQRAKVRERYEQILEPASLEQLDQQIALTPQEIEDIAEPLAEGLVEEGVDFPWWARVLLAAYAASSSRQAALRELERRYEAWQKQQEAQRPAA